MTKARVFKSGNSQAVRLPKQFRFDVKEVEIFRRGDEIILNGNRGVIWRGRLTPSRRYLMISWRMAGRTKCFRPQWTETDYHVEIRSLTPPSILCRLEGCGHPQKDTASVRHSRSSKI